MSSRRALDIAATPASAWQSLDCPSGAIVRSIAARMSADDLTLGERILLLPWERQLLRKRTVSNVAVHLLLAALVDERRRRASHREVEDGREAYE